MRSICRSKTFPHLKLFILGQSGVGKSTLADAIKTESNGVKGVAQGRINETIFFEALKLQMFLQASVRVCSSAS